MTLESSIIEKLMKKASTVSTAESLTGGMLAGGIVNASGASNVFKGSIIAYMLEIKEKELDIPKSVMGADAVNQETAMMMAKNISSKFGTTYGLATTGIAEKYDSRPPQAFVCIYNSLTDSYVNAHFTFEHSEKRQEVRHKVVQKTLRLFLKSI